MAMEACDTKLDQGFFEGLDPYMSAEAAQSLVTKIIEIVKHTPNSSFIEEKLHLLRDHMNHLVLQSHERREQLESVQGKEERRLDLPSEVSALQGLVHDLEKDLVSSNRIILHLRTEREKATVAFRTVTSHQARENSSLRKQLEQLKNDRDSREKEQFRLERCLQSCTLDLTMETESVKESRSRERVAVRRLTAAVDREKQERKKSSLKYSKEILEHKRAVDKLMVELQSEKKDRASDAKNWEIVVDELETAVETLKESNRKLLLEAEEERNFKDAANCRIHELSMELLSLHGVIGEKHVDLQTSLLEKELMQCRVDGITSRQKQLDNLTLSNMKALTDSVKMNQQNKSLAKLKFEQNDLVVETGAVTCVQPSKNLDQKSEEKSNAPIDYHKPAADSKKFETRDTRILLTEEDRAAVISDLRRQEMQHLEEMEAMECKFVSMEQRLFVLSAENENLRTIFGNIPNDVPVEYDQRKEIAINEKIALTELSHYQDKCDSDAVNITHKPPPSVQDCALQEAHDEIDKLKCKLQNLTVAYDRSQDELSTATLRHERVAAKLLLDLQNAEKALFQNNEIEVNNLIHHQQQLEALEEQMCSQTAEYTRLLEKKGDEILLTENCCKQHVSIIQRDLESILSTSDAQKAEILHLKNLVNQLSDEREKLLASHAIQSANIVTAKKEGERCGPEAKFQLDTALNDMDKIKRDLDSVAVSRNVVIADLQGIMYEISDAAGTIQVVSSNSAPEVTKVCSMLNTYLVELQTAQNDKCKEQAASEYSEVLAEKNDISKSLSEEIKFLKQENECVVDQLASSRSELERVLLERETQATEYSELLAEKNDISKSLSEEIKFLKQENECVVDQLASSRSELERVLLERETQATESNIPPVLKAVSLETIVSCSDISIQCDVWKEGTIDTNFEDIEGVGRLFQTNKKRLCELQSENEFLHVENLSLKSRLLQEVQINEGHSDVRGVEKSGRQPQEELDAKITALRSRNTALSKQLASFPPSLTVAQAEKRVLEARLEQLREDFKKKIVEEQHKSAQIQFELNAFMRREEQEKQNLIGKIRTQARTIDQLTRHVRQLLAHVEFNSEKSIMTETLGISGTKNVEIPMPWPLSDPLKEKFNNKDIPTVNEHQSWKKPDDTSSRRLMSFSFEAAQNKTLLGDYEILLTDYRNDPGTAVKIGNNCVPA